MIFLRYVADYSREALESASEIKHSSRKVEVLQLVMKETAFELSTERPDLNWFWNQLLRVSREPIVSHHHRHF